MRRGTSLLDMALSVLLLLVFVGAFVPQMTQQRRLHRLAQDKLRARGVVAAVAREILLDPAPARLEALAGVTRVIDGFHVQVAVGPLAPMPNAMLLRQVTVTARWFPPGQPMAEDSVAVVVGE